MKMKRFFINIYYYLICLLLLKLFKLCQVTNIFTNNFNKKPLQIIKSRNVLRVLLVGLRHSCVEITKDNPFFRTFHP
jgi:hypothetical protein